MRNTKFFQNCSGEFSNTNSSQFIYHFNNANSFLKKISKLEISFKHSDIPQTSIVPSQWSNRLAFESRSNGKKTQKFIIESLHGIHVVYLISRIRSVDVRSRPWASLHRHLSVSPVMSFIKMSGKKIFNQQTLCDRNCDVSAQNENCVFFSCCATVRRHLHDHPFDLRREN